MKAQLMRYVTALVVMLTLAGCASQSTDSGASLSASEESMIAALSERVAGSDQPTGLLFYPQQERRVVFEHIDALYPTRTVEACTNPYPLNDSFQDFSDLTYQVDGAVYSLDDFLAMPSAIGLLAVKDDSVSQGRA